MDNRFKITIEAVDRATKKIRDIKNEFSKFTKPISQMGASLKRLGKELGVDKIAKSVGNLGKVAVTAVGKIAALGAAIAGVVGVGSVVALAAYVREWAFAGAAIARTARIIGIGAGKLQSLELASQMAGLPVGTLTSSIKTLGDTMEDALYGRNQDALVVLNRLHVAIRKTKDGSIDVARALPDIADGISRIHNAQARSLAARTLGIEGLLPFLSNGRKGITEYERLVQKTGAVLSGPALRNAEKFQRSIVMLKLSLTGIGNQIMGKLGPALMPLIDKFTKWAQANKELFSTKIVEMAKEFADAISRITPKDIADAMGGLKQVLSFTSSVVKAISRMPTAALEYGMLGYFLFGRKGAIVLGALGYLTSPHELRDRSRGSDKPGTPFWDKSINSVVGNMFGGALKSGVSQTAMAYFQKQGWSKEQAAGMVANLSKESGLNPNAIGDNGRAYGIAQWHGDRQAAFKNWSGHDIRVSTLMEQLAFMNYELTQGAEKTAGNMLRSAKTASKAGEIVSQLYERPRGGASEAASRGMLASIIAAKAGRASGSLHKIELSGKVIGAKMNARVTSTSDDGASTYINNLALGSLPL